MKLATLRTDEADGALLLVTRDLTRMTPVLDIAPTLLAALDRWDRIEPALRQRAEELESGLCAGNPFVPADCAAPLPRAFQWCDGSAFLEHGRLMERAFKHPPRENFETIPLMYQGGSDSMLGPTEDVPLPDEAHGIDFEGEYVVITNQVPMGCGAEAALDHIVLIGQVNDWSLRTLIPREINTGFGFFWSKPSTSFAPVLITPDELGPDWRDGRVHSKLLIHWNDEWFGEPSGSEMHFHFGQLIAHAARTRRLGAGTVIGSGTVSNVDRSAGSACISERRVIEILQEGTAKTGFMKFGDTVRMAATTAAGATPFGTIEQKVVQAPIN